MMTFINNFVFYISIVCLISSIIITPVRSGLLDSLNILNGQQQNNGYLNNLSPFNNGRRGNGLSLLGQQNSLNILPNLGGSNVNSQNTQDLQALKGQTQKLLERLQELNRQKEQRQKDSQNNMTDIEGNNKEPGDNEGDLEGDKITKPYKNKEKGGMKKLTAKKFLIQFQPVKPEDEIVDRKVIAYYEE